MLQMLSLIAEEMKRLWLEMLGIHFKKNNYAMFICSC